MDAPSIVLLGNALLLGALYRGSTKRYGEPALGSAPFGTAESPIVPEGLSDALFAAGHLASDLSELSKRGLESTLGGGSGTSGILEKLFTQNAEIATVSLSEFDFDSEEFGSSQLKKALKDAGVAELGSPIARLATSTLTTLLTELIMKTMVLVACDTLGVTKQGFELIGLDGLVAKRALETAPEWSEWHSRSARQAREEEGWIDDLLNIAGRVILQPVVRKWAEVDLIESTREIGVATARAEMDKSINPDFKCDRLHELGRLFATRAGVDDNMLDTIFPSYGAMYPHRNYAVDADPFNVLTFALSQIGLRAIAEGWAICIAKDGLNGEFCTWVDPEGLDLLSVNAGLVRPDALGIGQVFELDEILLAKLGAENAIFVLTAEAAAQLDMDTSPKKELSARVPEPQTRGHENPEAPIVGEQPARKRSYYKGFKETDAPFVEEGLEMLKSGEAKSALNAAQLLIENHGEATEAEWKAGKRGIRSYTSGAAEARLQRLISKDWKERNQ